VIDELWRNDQGQEIDWPAYHSPSFDKSQLSGARPSREYGRHAGKGGLWNLLPPKAIVPRKTSESRVDPIKKLILQSVLPARLKKQSNYFLR